MNQQEKKELQQVKTEIQKEEQKHSWLLQRLQQLKALLAKKSIQEDQTAIEEVRRKIDQL